MNKKIFITATGTDVGKTYVSALILKKIRESGVNAGYFKPALSGAYRRGERLIPGDAEYVCTVSGLNVPPESVVSYCFEKPLSPHLAAMSEKRIIDPAVIKRDFDRISAEYDFVIIEGCGGIMCPLRMDKERVLLEDIIKLLDSDIIIVASAELGTINSTVLAAEYARSRGICIRGIILNRYDNSSIMHRDNKKCIEELTGLPVLACVSNGDTAINGDFFAEI
ncbi:MAG: dethiobiotin synthase [Clostridia bacterium]|nr:dethiobiotin synthase [Clostridia bacterium]